MTTRATTIQASKQRARALIGATAATIALVGGALLWQARPATETAMPATATTGSTFVGSTFNEGVAPLGGLAEQAREAQQAEAARAAARVTTRGGMAEFYAERTPVTATARVTAQGGMAELYAEQQTAARASAALLERIGGMAELYRDQGLGMAPADAARMGSLGGLNAPATTG